MTTPVLVAVPVLRRPHRVAPLLASVQQATDPDAYTVLFVTDPDDRDERREIRACGADFVDRPGSYAHKINEAYRATTNAAVFCAADDLDFHEGWLEAALRQLVGGIGVVGTNDLASPRVMAGRHATHSLVARWYADQFGTIDEPGAILHEGYRHNFCDDELLGTARRRRAYRFAADSHVRHLHPNFDATVERDATYLLGQQSFDQDRARFRRRRRMWGA